jgi:hypothetical protein
VTLKSIVNTALPVPSGSCKSFRKEGIPENGPQMIAIGLLPDIVPENVQPLKLENAPKGSFSPNIQ